MAAAETYANNPMALYRRGMNMLYESVKERGSTIIVLSSAVDSMNLGGLAGITSLAKASEANARDDGQPSSQRSLPGPWSPSDKSRR